MSSFSRRVFLAQSALATLAVATRADPPARIRIGQIGTGHAHASGKWGTVRRSADFEVVGLVENNPGRRASAEKSAGWADAPWMSEEELLAQPGLQVVCVETEVKDLLPTAARCLEAGKNIHLDKPAGESLSAFRALRTAAEKRGLIVQMGYMFRYHPAFLLCRQLVADGALGEIFSLEASIGKSMPASSRTKMITPYRGGAIFELGCHVIDPIVQILGRPQKVTSFARSTTDDGLAENQLAVLEYPKALATVRSALVEKDGEARRQFSVCGTLGNFEIRPLEPAQVHLVLESAHGPYAKGPQEVKLPHPTGRYDGDFADLAAVLRGEHPFGYSAEHDLAVQETVLRASGLPID